MWTLIEAQNGTKRIPYGLRTNPYDPHITANTQRDLVLAAQHNTKQHTQSNRLRTNSNSEFSFAFTWHLLWGYFILILEAHIAVRRENNLND